MATRGEIRTGVRYYLGESTPGIWQDEELNFFIQEACNEHAKRAWSVKTIDFTSSIRGVQDYEFPPNFGQLLSIRFRDEAVLDDWELEYIVKSVLRDMGYGDTEAGNPYYFYREQHAFGVYPIPSKPLVVDYTFQNACPAFESVYDRETRTDFSTDVVVEVVPDPNEPIEMVVPDTDLDPRCVWVSEVSVYVRRAGTYYPGNLHMTLTNLTDPHNFVHTSAAIPIHTLNARPEWVHFDFTPNPIEINPTAQAYRLQLHTDANYRAAVPTEYGGAGVVIGVQPMEGLPPQPFVKMHRYRNDFEVEYYQNTCDPLLSDDQVLQIPVEYEEHIVYMTLERANLKNGYNPQMAAFWGSKATAGIQEAKAMAMVPTIGPRRELRRTPPRLSNLTYSNRTGLFTLRLGR